MLGVKLTKEEMKEYLDMDATTEEVEGLPYDDDYEGKSDLCELLDPERKRSKKEYRNNEEEGE